LREGRREGRKAGIAIALWLIQLRVGALWGGLRRLCSVEVDGNVEQRLPVTNEPKA
jgi:hypothetical protein